MSGSTTEDTTDGSKARGPSSGIAAPTPSRRIATVAMDASMDALSSDPSCQYMPHPPQQPGFGFPY